MSATVQKGGRIIEEIEKQQVRRDLTRFQPGDTVRVYFQIVEGEKTRVQPFQGTVIKRSGGGNRETFTVRKVSFGVGVERIIPINSPRLVNVEIIARGDVRRSKLYYLRDLEGRAARIRARQFTDKERQWLAEEKDRLAQVKEELDAEQAAAEAAAQQAEAESQEQAEQQ